MDEFLKNEENSNDLSSSENESPVKANQGISCSKNDSVSQCPANELCRIKSDKSQQGECYCPMELGFYKIQGECREYLQISIDCSMYLNDCKKELREECVPKNRHSKHGTCQCQVGFRRNLNTFRCDPISANELIETLKLVEGKKVEMRPTTSTTTQKVNSRRRPLVIEEVSSNERKPDIKSEENLWKEILNELGVDDLRQKMKNDASDSFPPTKTNSLPKIVSSSQAPSTLNNTITTTTTKGTISETKTSTLSTTTPTTTTTTTTTITTTTFMTEAPSIFTSQLKANAGDDLDVYYPSSSVVLNGTMSKYSGDGRIVRWLWSKDDSSPAFGVKKKFFFGLKK